MELQVLPFALTVCKVPSLQDIDFNSELCFVGKPMKSFPWFAPQNLLPRTLSPGKMPYGCLHSPIMR